jgi:hypothetical protein
VRIDCLAEKVVWAVQRVLSKLRSARVSQSDSHRSGELAIRDHSLQSLIPQTTSKASPDVLSQERYCHGRLNLWKCLHLRVNHLTGIAIQFHEEHVPTALIGRRANRTTIAGNQNEHGPIGIGHGVTGVVRNICRAIS